MAHPKVARADHAILDLIRHRWSPRAFDPGRLVSRADLLRLLEAARWAASSFNEQPWRFVVATRDGTPEAYARLHAALRETNRAWAGAAPVLILVAVKTMHDRIDEENTHAWYDTGQAVSLLTIQATEQQMAVRQMQGFEADVAREACAVPPEFVPAVVMAVGYPGDPATLERSSHREAELKPRQRMPVTEIAFEAAWGQPLAPDG